MNFAESLGKALDGAKKAVVVGIGNELNGDDGFGVFVASKLGNFGKTVSILAHTVPENFISKIAAEKPSHVIFLDAAILDAEPGTLQLIIADDLARLRTMTHRIPLSKLIERLKGLHECQILIVGLEPKAMEVGTGLSKEAKRSAQKLVVLFKKYLS
jgi:hydrogenase 3 maturation protease